MTASSPSHERALLDRLTRSGRLNPTAVDRALRVREESGERLEAVLTNLGLVGERELAEQIADELSLPLVRAEDFPDRLVLGETVSPRFLERACVLPLSCDDGGVRLAMADPLDDFAKRAIAMSAGKPVLPCVAAPCDIQTALARLLEGGTNPLGQIVEGMDEAGIPGTLEDVDRLRDLASEAPVIRLVNHLIARAIESRASDVHIEPFRNRLVVRYRIDGILHNAAEPPVNLVGPVVSRIKIMAKLNIAERRLPQDGRIRFTFRGHDLDLRVSTMPTLYGETVVMRILDRSGLVEEFAQLGFLGEAEAALKAALARPQGMLLVTGPTGSGKTTTLYTSLMRLNAPDRKLFTVEDPIEYELEGVNQVQVKSQIGLGFAHVLRSILRQDPDIIMIGEIRDLETAEVAMQAALTGHLVLSTLHTNDAASSVTRLLDMGVADYLVTSTLHTVLAQRLVRRLCPHCREPHAILPELARELCAPVEGGAAPMMYRAVGCSACHFTGYRGRTVINETLTLDDRLRRMILQRADARLLQDAAKDSGMRPMFVDGVRKAVAGITTLEEVMRVTQES